MIVIHAFYGWVFGQRSDSGHLETNRHFSWGEWDVKRVCRHPCELQSTISQNPSWDVVQPAVLWSLIPWSVLLNPQQTHWKAAYLARVLLSLSLLNRLTVSDLTEEPRKPKITLKSFMLSMIESSQYMGWHLFKAESSNHGHVCVRSGPWSNGRQWPGLMDHIFFSSLRTAGCTWMVLL